ncbi:hypothetical protein SSBR45G_33020 [Bradyrhizobium sp. SSBR45G]|uniref:hypothetical protein n=1 Tax=unclassified Bradyrhizobium TaxID=2631580 RepID=UPI0023429627|nr:MULTISPECIES: hypothetical protein [unclassified Bradyrhizobium]GLH78393.1 hypothetical protein SSBR45G_33020 [Bradyrhizobium sp. SSBR45G]GLH86176.1 hypothetical protein SSBR45R_36360 [Bradyrhizobium sp. SSBR45R]
MSQTGKVVIFGTLAASAMLVGAIQLASGHDLASDVPQTSAGDISNVTAGSVNRASKTDRAAAVAGATSTQTVSVKLAAFAETTFLLRLPLTPSGVTAGGSSVPTRLQTGSQIISAENERRVTKHPIACEPSVSVLTEIAKRLQPGRCVT